MQKRRTYVVAQCYCKWERKVYLEQSSKDLKKDCCHLFNSGRFPMRLSTSLGNTLQRSEVGGQGSEYDDNYMYTRH